jgi:hypothetical protein
MDKKILKYDGRPISADEIVATIKGAGRDTTAPRPATNRA